MINWKKKKYSGLPKLVLRSWNGYTKDFYIIKKDSVPYGKLFTPEYSTQKLLEVLTGLTSKQIGKCFAWDGKEILPWSPLSKTSERLYLTLFTI